MRSRSCEKIDSPELASYSLRSAALPEASWLDAAMLPRNPEILSDSELESEDSMDSSNSCTSMFFCTRSFLFSTKNL